MRALGISVTICLLMVGVIVLGTQYGRRVGEQMHASLDALPDEPSEACAAQAEQLLSDWQQRLPYLRPIVNRAVLRGVSDLLSDLAVYATADDSTADFHATRQKLYVAVDEMRRAEKATFGLWT